MTDPNNPKNIGGAALSTEAGAWVRETLARMPLREKLGQLLMVGCFPSHAPEDLAAAIRAVEELHVGGFMIATRPGANGIQRAEARTTARMTGELQKRAKVPLIFGADLERGLAMRVDGGTSFPQAMAIGATGNPADAYTVGRVTALESRAVGIHWIFAPVADVNSNPENPIVNIRSFGEEPGRVAEFVTAFVRGVQENGALACAKHFPGHGDTQTDSHLEMPVLGVDRARLERVELVPFRAAIEAGVGSVMTGHLNVPAIEAGSDAGLPATLSRRITANLLRGELGFRGLAITDAMDMSGVTAKFSAGEAAVRAVEAGADVVLMSPDAAAALAALEDAVTRGQLPVERVDEAATRVLLTKAELGLRELRGAGAAAVANVTALLGRAEYLEAAREIAERGATLLRNGDGIAPLNGTAAKRVLFCAIAGDADASPGAAMERALRERCSVVQSLRCDTKFAKAESAAWPSAETYDIAIVALLVRVADRKGSVSLPAEQIGLVEKLLRAGKPAIVAAFGSPYVIERFPAARTWIAAFSTTDVAQTGLVRALFGETPIGGRLPVSVPGASPPLAIEAGLQVAARRGGEDSRLAPAYSLLERAVSERAFPGGVLAVQFRGELSVGAVGRQTYEADSPKVTADTIYDLASLTKPIVTATLAAQMAENGQLDFDAPVGAYLPEWMSGPAPEVRKRVTLRHLLTHSSGLPAHVDYFKVAKSKQEIVGLVAREALVYEPGAKSEYSDLDFILLGAIIERVTGRTLDRLAHEQIFAPLAMRDAMFNPPLNLRGRIAPTEIDATYRKRLIHGEVHDENAYAMGGVAGHAGLFATAGNVARFAQAMLNGGALGANRILRADTVAEITKAQPLSGGARTLGWMVPTQPSSSGHYLSKSSYGHTGFTGTSLWIDAEKQLAVILLTNRVCPTRENDKITKVRPAVHDAIVEGLRLVR